MLLVSSPAHAEDRADTTVTWFQERRTGDASLTVIHPQVDLGIGLGSKANLSAGYEADIVTGATPSVYAVSRQGGGVDTVTSASQFSDVRHQGHVGLGFTGNRATLNVGYSYGSERDYRSHTVSASGSVDLPGKNTTFTLGYSRNIDSVCDYDNGDAVPLARRPLTGTNECFTDDASAKTLTLPVNIDTAQASITQNLSPTMVMQIGIYGQIVNGFQSNPYRRVRVFSVDAQETIPEVRDRGAAFLRLNLAIPATRTALSLFARGYSDTWGVNSGSVEAMVHQYMGSRILFRLRGRFYRQTSAIFFRDAQDYELVGPVGQYFTGDRELSPFQDLLVGGKLSILAQAHDGKPVWGLFDEIDFHLNAEALWYDALTPNPPGGVISGPVPAAIIAQVGLLLRY